MDTEKDVLALLRRVEAGEMKPEDALLQLKLEPYKDIGFAKVDMHRGLRQGVPEVIYGASKTPEQIVGILEAMQKHGCKNILVTRIPQETADVIAHSFPVEYNQLARLARVFPAETEQHGAIVIATGGTSDMGVAEEAALTAEALGNRVTRLYDVGVAGVHRLLAHLGELQSASVLIAVAGMEGALASVAGGLVDCPVLAVPTSVGYGASFGGLAALLAMLNSCASGVSVVNIDNGFGAGYQASMINHMEART